MATTLIALEEYLNTSYEPDMEFVDGALVGRNVGTPLHGRLQALLAIFFHQFSITHGIRVIVECRLLMDAATSRCRIPDVMVMEGRYKKGKVITDIPVAVVEIKSPEDRLRELTEKCREYAALGVPNILVLDPDRRRLYVFENSALQLVESCVLRLPKSGTEIAFQADQLFDEDEMD